MVNSRFRDCPSCGGEMYHKYVCGCGFFWICKGCSKVIEIEGKYDAGDRVEGFVNDWSSYYEARDI